MHDLFDVEVPRQRHSATSTASAEAEAPRFKGNLVRVLKAFAERSKHGFTDEQGGDHLYMTGNRPLRVKLENLGLVIKTTPPGRPKPAALQRSTCHHERQARSLALRVSHSATINQGRYC